MESVLWTEKYCPKKYADFIGNSEAIAKTKKWFAEFFENKNKHKILLFYGPPGIGKTALAFAALNEANYRPLEYNCNNITDIKEMKEVVRKSIGHANILDMFNGNLKPSGVILDDVDNITNGIAELVTMLKTDDEVNSPIICTCNNLGTRGLKPLRACAEEIRFNKPTKYDMEQMIKMVSKKEGMKLEQDTYYLIINSTQSDWRKLLGILQELKAVYGNKVIIDIEKVTKVVAYMQNKDVDLQLNDIINRIFNKPLSFEECNLLFVTDSLNVPLLVYENYHQVLFGGGGEEGATAVATTRDAKTTLDKFCNISNNMVNYDITSTNIFENQDWRLTNYVGLYAANMTNYELTHNKKTLGAYYSVGFSTLFNKISQHRRNIKMVNHLPIVLETSIPYSDLYILSELFIYNLFNKGGRLDYVVKIMDKLGFNMTGENDDSFNIDALNTILSLNTNKTKKITAKIKNDMKQIYNALRS